MILKIYLRAKAGVAKTIMKRKLRLHSLYFPQNLLMLTESRVEFSDLHSIFRFRARRYRDLTQNTTATATRTSLNKGFKSRTIAVHVRYKSLYISLPPSANDNMKFTNSLLSEEREPRRLIFRISIWN